MPAPVPTAMETIEHHAYASTPRPSSALGSPSKPTSPPGTRVSVATAAATTPALIRPKTFTPRHVFERHRDRVQVCAAHHRCIRLSGSNLFGKADSFLHVSLRYYAINESMWVQIANRFSRRSPRGDPCNLQIKCSSPPSSLISFVRYWCLVSD